MMLGPKEDIVVEREHGNVNGDVVVNGTVGIEMKRDLNNSNTSRLRGQIEEYQKEYSHVIPVACGINDMDGWRKLKNDYENQMDMGMNPDNAPVKFIYKQKSDYGKGDSADNYQRSGSGNSQQDVELDELVNVIEDGVKGYKSLSGDGPMDSGEAMVAVAQLVLVGGLILVVTGIVLFNVVL